MFLQARQILLIKTFNNDLSRFGMGSLGIRAGKKNSQKQNANQSFHIFLI